MTTSETDSEGIWGVRAAGWVSNTAWGATPARTRRVAASQSRNSMRVFLRMRAGTSRGVGVWLRSALIFRCDLTETAWLGGRV